MFFLSESWWALPLKTQISGSIILLVTAGILVLLLTMVVKAIRVKQVKIGNNIVELGADGKPISTEEVIEKRKMELRFVISKSLVYSGDVHTIMMIDTIRDQMNAAQPKVDDIRGLLIKLYTQKLEAMEAAGAEVSKVNYLIFDEFISNIIRNKVLFEIKRAFKENHLLDIPETTFEEVYCRPTANRILTNMRADIKNRLPETLTPSVKDVLDIFDDQEDRFLKILREIFFAGRVISARYRDEIAKKTENYEKAILELTTVNKQDISDILGFKL